MTAGRKVARNSFWYGLEVVFGAIVTLGTSIVMSRVFGPERLGYYNYLVWLTYVAGALGTVGLSAATQKYMAEFLGRGEPGMAYRIFWLGFKAQAVMVVTVVSVALTLVWFTVPLEYRWIGVWLVVAIVPRMLGFIVSQINAVIEDMSRNIPAMLAANLITVTITMAAIWFDWGLVGIAASHPAGHAADLLIKFGMTRQTRRQWSAGGVPTLDAALIRRMRTFAFQGLGLALLAVVVWDRSDVLLLKHMQPDLRQVSFFSYSYTMVEKLLLIPQVMGAAMGFNLLTQYGRDAKRVVALAVSSASYLLLIGLPVLLGAVALSRPIWTIYGDKFGPAVPVFVLMTLLALPRVVLAPANSLLQASEKQGFLVWWGCICGAINIAVDVLLIPAYGALGAAAGNGIGQTLAAAGAWTYIARTFSPDLQAGRLARIAFSAVTMAVAAAIPAWQLAAAPGFALGLLTGVAVYLVMLRLTRALDGSDRERFLSLASAVPASLRYPCKRIVWGVIPQSS